LNPVATLKRARPARRAPATAGRRKNAAKADAARKAQLWPSEAEQTLQAIRSGRVDALIIPHGQGENVYALRTFEELEEANRRLLETQQQLLVLMNERERLMQDLHDGCIQSIYAVGLALEDCRGVIRKHPGEAEKKVARAAAGLNLVIQELRAFITGNRNPAPIDFAREIDRMIETVGVRGPRFDVRIDAAAARALPRDRAAQLLQIAREGVSNVVRHARARSSRIVLRQRGRTVRLELTDDGVGFKRDAQKPDGLGLHHIAARVQKLGGAFELTSAPGKGCRIVVEIPARGG
jgi:signal transduction histidine kinase